MSVVFRTDDPVRDAAAYTAHGDCVEAARVLYASEREREIRRDLQRPLQACIDGSYSTEHRPPIGAEIVAWVMATNGEPQRALAEAIWSEQARAHLVERWLAERVEWDAQQVLARGGFE